MIFDVYFPFKNKANVTCPGVKPHPFSWDEILTLMRKPDHCATIDTLRKLPDDAKKELREELKKSLPAVTFCGRTEKQRAARNMTPTGLVMIDIDHCEDPVKAWETIREEAGAGWLAQECALAHITVSGKGLRVVFAARPDLSTLQDNMEWFNTTFKLERFGDFDAPCKDFSRLSFLPKYTDILFFNEAALNENGNSFDKGYLTNTDAEGEDKDDAPKTSADTEGVDNFTEAERLELEGFEYKGYPVKAIIEKWVEVNGEPGKGEIHNYYNDMVKNFRNIVSNNKRALLYLLPRFGHTADECWSSIKSICRVNTLSTLPKNFYFFLKDNGFYGKTISTTGSLAEYMLSDEEEVKPQQIPWLPPVFREFVRVTPKDFRPAVVNALMPVMGTLTSYLQAPYYYDGRFHTTSFFSIVYAPAGTGKGFAERIINVLFEKLKIRDYIQQARENIYLQTMNRKGDNERSPADPHTTMRIIPPKNSEAEFLDTMQDCHGYHLFTYAAEMDSWAKGAKAAGGNKDDMIRIAWDNGEYGQQFKSANTFKGTVSLYWNVLITGTIQQLMAYFKNVENGLITRCAFTTIENQEFAPPPVWKSFSKKDMDVIRKFMERCDRNTYAEPCTLLREDVDCVSPDKFDEEVDWRFTFRKKQEINMEWLRPTIEEFLEAQRKRASRELDKARDVFRRRVAVRGFRLGMMCYALWDKPRETDLKKCIPFIQWWMEQDIEGSMKLWGIRYNNETETDLPIPRKAMFNDLPQVFDKTDVYTRCVRMGIKTPIRNIIYLWRNNGYIKKNDEGKYEKIPQNSKV